MPALDFSKWSPGGNTTLFFPAAGLDAARQAELARQAMRPDSLGAEQAGFVSVEERRLRMAGGEFCVNATRAFGALLAFRESASPEATLQGIARQKLANEHRYEVQVSGWQTPIRLQVRGTSPHWQVRAELQLPPCPTRNRASIWCACPASVTCCWTARSTCSPRTASPPRACCAASTA
ncbi:hypothetical protein [Desulfovibrio sp.]|uniref:hypothetical protein n=1 Tax=Desulfovibrio sp. TaxID=885 RepID=UPI00307CCF1A